MATEIPVLGQLIQDDSARRDAIHIAVAPVIANTDLEPGEHVGVFYHDGSWYAGNTKEKVGIVDPFLKKAVKEKQKFWLFLYPGTITSLRHLWEHPAFKIKAPPRFAME